MELVDTGLPLSEGPDGLSCENCGAPGARGVELSLLVESDGELTHTELICITRYCDGCTASISSRNWGLLSRRAAAQHRRLPSSALRIVN